jgi:hypothetical protein
VEAEERGEGREEGGEERWRQRREVEVEQRCGAIVSLLGQGGLYPADHNVGHCSWGEEEEVPHLLDKYGDVGPPKHPEPTIKSKAYNQKNGDDTTIKSEGGEDEGGGGEGRAVRGKDGGGGGDEGGGGDNKGDGGGVRGGVRGEVGCRGEGRGGGGGGGVGGEGGDRGEGGGGRGEVRGEGGDYVSSMRVGFNSN